MKGCCSDCAFCSYHGDCHLNPPVYIGLQAPNYNSSMIHTFIFPKVNPNDWCSHFQKKKERDIRETVDY